MLQRRYGPERSPFARKLPVGQQLVTMKPSPFRNETKGPRRETAAQQSQWVELDLGLEPGVVGVEVGWLMVVVEHRDDDAVEAADLGHLLTVEVASCLAIGAHLAGATSISAY